MLYHALAPEMMELKKFYPKPPIRAVGPKKAFRTFYKRKRHFNSPAYDMYDGGGPRRGRSSRRVHSNGGQWRQLNNRNVDQKETFGKRRFRSLKPDDTCEYSCVFASI